MLRQRMMRSNAGATSSGERSRHHQYGVRGPRGSDSGDDDGALRPWTPTSAIETTSEQNWGSQPSSLVGSESGTGGQESSGGTVGGGSPEKSRRSSLKSTSVMELENVGRNDSPGPAHTEDPLEAIGAMKPGKIERKISFFISVSTIMHFELFQPWW